MNKEVLWLPGWYPSKIDLSTGDFIQRHAIAVAAHVPVHVLFFVRDKEKRITQDIKIEEHKNGNLTETVIYYAIGGHSIPVWDRLISMRKFISAYKKYLNDYILKKGLPTAVHVHVPYKAGLVAVWLKNKFGLNYFVTEHWAGYNRDNPDNFYNRPWSFRSITKRILKQAELVLPVSDELGQQLKTIVPSINTKSIPNTVDNKLFYPAEKNSEVFRLVHYASSWKGQKNTEGIIRVLKNLLGNKQGWECVMYGPAGEELKNMVQQNGLETQVKFTGEISYTEVGELVRTASAFITFSNYENQPCSILEALCCGVPVIATRVGGIPEIINASNGILIDPKNENQLLLAIEQLMENHRQYNKQQIAADAINKFGYEAVGKQIAALYQSDTKTDD